MAPGYSAQKRKKELEPRRERKAAEAAERLEAATATGEPTNANPREEAVGSLVPVPSLEETNPSGLVAGGSGAGGGATGGAGTGVVEGHSDARPPLSIRTKRGPKESEVVDMSTGKKVTGPPEKLGIVTGTKTAYLKMMNNHQPLNVEYAEEHKGPKELKWRTLMSRDIGSAVRSKVPMLAPSFAELAEEHRDALNTYIEMFYDLPPTETGMWKYIDEIAAKIYKDWKYDCHTHYVEVSKATPAEFIHRPKQWEYLKVHFEDGDYNAMCARNASNRNKGKEKGFAINHHSSTTPYSYRVAANEQKGHLAPILQTVCDVYQSSQNAQEKVAAVKRKMEELCASRASDEAGGSQLTGPVPIPVEEQMAVVEKELGGKPGTRVRGLGGALRRLPKPRGGARVSRKDDDLRSKLAAVHEENADLKRRMAQMEATVQAFMAAQGHLGDNVAATAPIADKSSCASLGIPNDDLD